MQTVESTVKEFSKNALIKLNRALRDNETPSADALCELQKYRLSHKELAKEVFDILVEQAKLINEKAICAFRIKRLDSIIRKVKRLEGSIELKSMGDIAGCRCILDSDNEVYQLMRMLKNHPKLVINEEGVNNYIKYPKKSGYKSIHMYVTIDGYGKRKVEIQLRSKVHHDWATFVEVLDTVYKINVKEGLMGKPLSTYTDFCLFHKILSKKDEHLDTEEVKTILSLIAKHDILQEVSMLMIRNVANVRKQWADMLSQCPYIPKNFYISTNDKKEPTIQAFESYTQSEEYYYLQFEQNSTTNQVLVCIDSASFDSISRAYSNYILVCHEFAHRLHRIMAKAMKNPSFDITFLRKFIIYYKKRILQLVQHLHIEKEELSRAKYDDDIMNEWFSDLENSLERFDDDSRLLSMASNRFMVNNAKGLEKVVAWWYYIKGWMQHVLHIGRL